MNKDVESCHLALFHFVKKQHGKPLFIPAKQELLNYKDEFYIDDTPQHPTCIKQRIY